MVYKFFDKKSIGDGIAKPTADPSALARSSLKRVAKDSSLILADELHKPVIKKFNKRKVYSQFSSH